MASHRGHCTQGSCRHACQTSPSRQSTHGAHVTSRHRWFQADWPTPPRTLAKRLRQHSFADDTQCGFILDRVRDEYLEGRYIERYEFQETVADPFGKEVTVDRLEYRQAAFRVAPGWPGLELIDAPRSSQSLVNALLESTDFALPIQLLTLDVLRWVDAL